MKMNAFKAWLPLLKVVLIMMLFFVVIIPACGVINDRFDEQDQAQIAFIEAHKAEIKSNWNKEN